MGFKPEIYKYQDKSLAKGKREAAGVDAGLNPDIIPTCKTVPSEAMPVLPSPLARDVQ